MYSGDLSLLSQYFDQEMDRLICFYNKYYKKNEFNSICVAVSGGADSVTLLLLLEKWSRKNNWKLYCVTVDHQLREESIEEALYVKSLCDKLNVPHTILKWEHEQIENHGHLESAAREARYNLLKQFCKEKNVNFIATGHNWNDQLETYELRKDFGSGDIGLAGMSQVRSIDSDLVILRPLLTFFKKDFEKFLTLNHIEWKTDFMNFDENFQRVKSRNRINQYSEEKISEISREIEKYGKARYQIEKSAVFFIKNYCKFSQFGFCEINMNEFLKISEEIQAETLRKIIWDVGGKFYPTQISVNSVSDIINRKMNTVGRCLIKVKKKTIFIFRENRNIEKIILKNEQHDVIWDNRFRIKIAENCFNGVIFSANEEYATEIPLLALHGFPCLYENHKVKYSLDLWTKHMVSVIHKPELWDVYCGVDCG